MRVSRTISIYRAQRSQQGCSLSLGMLRLAEPPTGRARLRSSLESPRNPITPIETSRAAALHPGRFQRMSCSDKTKRNQPIMANFLSGTLIFLYSSIVRIEVTPKEITLNGTMENATIVGTLVIHGFTAVHICTIAAQSMP